MKHGWIVLTGAVLACLLAGGASANPASRVPRASARAASFDPNVPPNVNRPCPAGPVGPAHSSAENGRCPQTVVSIVLASGTQQGRRRGLEQATVCGPFYSPRFGIEICGALPSSRITLTTPKGKVLGSSSHRIRLGSFALAVALSKGDVLHVYAQGRQVASAAYNLSKCGHVRRVISNTTKLLAWVDTDNVCGGGSAPPSAGR
jgi:hypothetical protein